MLARLHAALEAWRRLGPRRFAATLAGLALARVRMPLRRARLRVAPLKAGPREVARALGGATPVAALRGSALAALPTVARWEEELERLDDAQRAELLARAERVLRHEFDLLGSGPAPLGPAIPWHMDFKAGRTWPLDHISRIVVSYPDGSDIKVPWELSRFQHLPLLAAAHRLTGERRWLDELGAQLDDWIARNPVEHGPNWQCTMDVAIRAANWVAALALCAEAAAREPWLERALASLLLHGRFIRSHLEWGDVRGNHYLSDVVGLLPVAALFAGSAEGRAWADWAVAELEGELAHQVREDGCDHEASIPYHRLVCELFVCGAQAADALRPGRLSDAFRTRLDRMLAFAADATRPDGRSPQVGDADSGRFLPLGDYGAGDQRDHAHLFRQAHRPTPRPAAHAAYPHGGYYVMRHGDLYALVRCGDVGLHGIGAHAHNDQLSFELACGGDALVQDPGSFLYTASAEERNRFRSTAFHATLQIGGAEQSPLAGDYLFALPDRARAEALAWEADGAHARFAGRHHGYAALDPPAVHERELRFDGAARTLTLLDTVRSAGAHALEWTFPLAPCEASGGEGRAEALFAAHRLTIEAPGLTFAVEDGWQSPAYGVRVAAPFLRARRTSRPGEDVTELVLRVAAR
ncbi:MAG: alginate lyase family protein [Actinobacteria bacterium]|nr:alginate lyase family protein [Actinomycetota bacterium]